MSIQSQFMTEFMARLIKEGNDSNKLDTVVLDMTGKAGCLNIVSDMKKDIAANTMDTFLKSFCDIDLYNSDTGSLAGYDCSGGPVYTADTIIEESGALQTMSGTSEIVEGLTITYPERSTLSANEQFIVDCLHTWWYPQSFGRVKESLGLDVNEKSFVKEMPTSFVDIPANNGAVVGAYVSYKYDKSNGQIASISCIINISNDAYGNLDTNNYNGVSPALGPANALDRTLLHELTHAMMGANIAWYPTFPKFFKEGSAELITGCDDSRGYFIQQLVSNTALLDEGFTDTASNPIYMYVSGFIFLRYLIKQYAEEYMKRTIIFSINRIIPKKILYGLSDVNRVDCNGITVWEKEQEDDSIYGIVIIPGASSAQWQRTKNGQAVTGLCYDDIYPWSEMETHVIYGRTVVKHPKFYVRSGVYSSGPFAGKYYWEICRKKLPGFECHPAFMYDGQEKDCFYRGADKANNGRTNSPGTSGSNSVASACCSLADGRTNAMKLNDSSGEGERAGWHVENIYEYHCTTLLWLIETGHANSQATGMTYRGIKSLYGNYAEPVDGIKQVNGKWAFWDAKGICAAESMKKKTTYTNPTGYVNTDLSVAAGSGFIRGIYDASDSNFHFQAYLFIPYQMSATSQLLPDGANIVMNNNNCVMLGHWKDRGEWMGIFGFESVVDANTRDWTQSGIHEYYCYRLCKYDI